MSNFSPITNGFAGMFHTAWEERMRTVSSEKCVDTQPIASERRWCCGACKRIRYSVAADGDLSISVLQLLNSVLAMEPGQRPATRRATLTSICESFTVVGHFKFRKD
ncbi:hypothetical protein Y032_0011g1265 [Ancylostoma ceylanicum]|uniref:Uncharacterized protein n=1 Tax=Ancylostoma ceylanicum TaxID=53326 RepID=A0A016VD49_9BILA|nr:hypothetical protein Y032_0011g1265 [Ancylostoma ceylanicum]